MLPVDAPEADWNLYYNGTIMLHRSKGPVQIKVRNSEAIEPGGGQELIAYPILKSGELGHGALCNPNELKIFWPRPGAYNLRGDQREAIIVGRQTQRHMKRSADASHYYIIWGNPQHAGGMNLLKTMARPLPYSDVCFAPEMAGTNSSVALSSQVILSCSKSTMLIDVLYQAERIGLLNDDRSFNPFVPGDSRLPRFKRYLLQVGII